MSERPRTILFTGFEPSGDDHAAAVVAELKRRYPDLRIAAWGGPNMERAGAEIVEWTGENSVVGLPGPKTILNQRATNRRIFGWMDANPFDVHVPVDAPAANFPICAAAKKHGAKVVHLVAPQVWAWGAWRIKKLKRLTDFVCCLLPFEESFFEREGVPARFVGHPLFDEPIDERELDDASARWPADEPRIALMPGSRPGEIKRNAPLLLEAFRDLSLEHPGATGVVAAAGERAAAMLREIATAQGGWPDRLRIAVSETDAVIRWCQLSLVVSGTVTLQIARQRRPMVIVYKSSRLLYNLVGRWLLQAPFFTLPNLVADREIVPELVPHFDGFEPLAQEARELLGNPERLELQRSALGEVASRFDGYTAARAAADAIAQVADLGPPGTDEAPATPSQPGSELGSPAPVGPESA
ncbi:MAG: hypothetical protein AAGI53_08565 [Planctomycetota bacterium]